MIYQINDEVEGIVTGIQPYGVFVCIDAHNQGLVHISEITNDYVANIHDYIKINDKVKVKIIGIDAKSFQLRLSMKAVHSRKQRRHQQFKKQRNLPAMEIGFDSLKKKLPQWIQEAKEKLLND